MKQDPTKGGFHVRPCSASILVVLVRLVMVLFERSIMKKIKAMQLRGRFVFILFHGRIIGWGDPILIIIIRSSVVFSIVFLLPTTTTPWHDNMEAIHDLLQAIQTLFFLNQRLISRS